MAFFSAAAVSAATGGAAATLEAEAEAEAETAAVAGTRRGNEEGEEAAGTTAGAAGAAAPETTAAAAVEVLLFVGRRALESRGTGMARFVCFVSRRRSESEGGEEEEKVEGEEVEGDEWTRRVSRSLSPSFEGKKKKHILSLFERGNWKETVSSKKTKMRPDWPARDPAAAAASSSARSPSRSPSPQPSPTRAAGRNVAAALRSSGSVAAKAMPDAATMAKKSHSSSLPPRAPVTATADASIPPNDNFKVRRLRCGLEKSGEKGADRKRVRE